MRPQRSGVARWVRRILAVVFGLPLLAVAAFLLYILAFFNAGRLYSGDGVWRKNGGSGEAPLLVEFPSIRLDRTVRREFRFTHLEPAIDDTVGLRLLGTHENPIAARRLPRHDPPPS